MRRYSDKHLRIHTVNPIYHLLQLLSINSSLVADSCSTLCTSTSQTKKTTYCITLQAFGNLIVNANN